MAVTAVVTERPPCDFCGEEAHFDGKTSRGPWAFMCLPCYRTWGTGLGEGRGQRLYLEHELEG